MSQNAMCVAGLWGKRPLQLKKIDRRYYMRMTKLDHPPTINEFADHLRGMSTRSNESADSGVACNVYGNLQTRWFCGFGDECEDVCSEAALASAKQAVLHSYDLVGFAEYFPATLQLLQADLPMLGGKLVATYDALKSQHMEFENSNPVETEKPTPATIALLNRRECQVCAVVCIMLVSWIFSIAFHHPPFRADASPPCKIQLNDITSRSPSTAGKHAGDGAPLTRSVLCAGGDGVVQDVELYSFALALFRDRVARHDCCTPRTTDGDAATTLAPLDTGALTACCPHQPTCEYTQCAAWGAALATSGRHVRKEAAPLVQSMERLHP